MSVIQQTGEGADFSAMNCPMCGRHCPLSEPHCRKGEMYLERLRSGEEMPERIDEAEDSIGGDRERYRGSHAYGERGRGEHVKGGRRGHGPDGRGMPHGEGAEGHHRHAGGCKHWDHESTQAHHRHEDEADRGEHENTQDHRKHEGES